MKTTLIFIFLIVLTSLMNAQQPTFRDLDYVGSGNSKQFLDLYIPSWLTQPAPLIIYFHGGGWKGGSKGNAMGFCDTLFAHGYIVADINYRLSGDTVFPAQIYDCKAAVRWLKVHAAQYNIDTNRIAVSGSSAGGHLASLLGTSADVDSLEDFGLGSITVTSNVHAVISFYGPSDFLQMDSHIPLTPPDSCTTPLIHDVPDSPEAQLLGCQISLCPERVRKANPVTYIDEADPPFKIYHGTFDCSVPPHQSILLDSALKASGVFSSLSLLEHIGHAFRPNSDGKQEILEFLNTHLTDPPTSVRYTEYPSDENNIPLVFEMRQNYPNPFNPSTTIEYTIPPNPSLSPLYQRGDEGGVVTLKVYDILGREVVTLVNEYQQPGNHSVEFGTQNSGVPSGIYFYTLKISPSTSSGFEFQETKKMILLK